MTRTIRRLAVNRHRGGAKRYRSRFDTKDLTILRAYKKEPPRSEWSSRVWVDYVKEKHVYATRTVETFYMQRGKKVWWSYEQDYCVETIRTPARYRSRKCNPDYDWEVDRIHSIWLQTHHHVYRNGSCHRQRMKAIRQDKQRENQEDRARAKMALLKLVDEIYHEAYLDRIEVSDFETDC